MMAPRTGGHDAATRWPAPVGDDPAGPGLTVAPTQPRRGLVLVRVLGEVDMLTAGRLRDVLDGALRAVAEERDAAPDTTAHAEAPSVVCDLEGVTFLGASGLDTFAAAHEAAVERGVRLVLVAAHRTVVRPLRLTTLDRCLTVLATHPALGGRVPAGQGTR
ncbi:STAS domain-containing protein [Actinomycetospora lutea]|uniref:STAS domain-containing protein n=1 Tax=Actinomycetospora lutea TaxID=663604 RepID=UPI0023673280|nr:STAS domain-containing protein [Actinomycetospora lutea]MDD7940251.1 STAS domain-containing protein [Actinomycetospora lutea]